MQQTNAFPTFAYYWRALTRPKRRYRVSAPARQVMNPVARSGGSFQCEGQLALNNSGEFAINGESFVIDSETWVFGDIKPGVQARVQGVTRGGVRRATKVTVS